MNDTESDSLIELTADIVSAYVSNNSVSAGDLPNLINQVHSALLRRLRRAERRRSPSRSSPRCR